MRKLDKPVLLGVNKIEERHRACNPAPEAATLHYAPEAATRPYAPEAAALWLEAATLCIGGCHPAQELDRAREEVAEFWRLGLGEPYPP